MNLQIILCEYENDIRPHYSLLLGRNSHNFDTLRRVTTFWKTSIVFDVAMNEREFDFSLQVSTSESKPHSTTLLTVTLCDPGMATSTYFIRKLFKKLLGSHCS